MIRIFNNFPISIGIVFITISVLVMAKNTLNFQFKHILLVKFHYFFKSKHEISKTCNFKDFIKLNLIPHNANTKETRICKQRV